MKCHICQLVPFKIKCNLCEGCQATAAPEGQKLNPADSASRTNLSHQSTLTWDKQRTWGNDLHRLSIKSSSLGVLLTSHVSVCPRPVAPGPFGPARLKNMKATVEELQAERRGKLLSIHKSCLHTANGNVSNFSYDKTNVWVCYSVLLYSILFCGHVHCASCHISVLRC